jgi:hypothetical protein
VHLTRTAGDGTLTASSAGGVTVGGSASDLTLTGTISAINAFLAANLVTLDSQGNDDDTFTISINDGALTTTKTGLAVSDTSFTSSTSAEVNNLAGVNVFETTYNAGNGNDTIYTSWSHVGASPTNYTEVGSTGTDTINLIFTPGQLQEILANAATRDDLQGFLSAPVSDSLATGATAWHATVGTGFETANIRLANLFSTRDTATPGNNFIDINSTWKSVLTGSELVGTDGGAGNDFIVANAAGTRLGGTGNDVLVAFNAGNTLNGEGGSDLLLGGSGNDTLIGGLGSDLLAGGAGADTFKWNASAAAEPPGATNADTVVDYNFAEGDKIDLSALLDANYQNGDSISQFIRLSASGNNLSVSVDPNGTGSFASGLTYTLVGANTLSTTDPIRIFFEGADHVLTDGNIDPIVLDLGEKGIAFKSLAYGVHFDVNADGTLDQLAWTTGEDGFLAYDLDGSGKIENGTELFTPNFAGSHYADGLSALASLDSNSDGSIDASDAAFNDLLVWQDANHDGISDTTELSSLTDFGIAAISLGATPADGDIDGQMLQNQGSFSYADGTTGTFVEVTLDTALGNAPIHGTDGSDTLVGSAGNDLLDGGDGVDTVSYAGANSSVTVNLAQGSATSSDGSDTLISIENIIGSGFGDSLMGNSHDNVLSGGLGADTFHIGADFGHDTITDYRPAQEGDILEFSTDVFADIVAMLNAASNDGSGNVAITADTDNSIILQGVTKADLEAHHDYLLFT